MNCSVIFHHTHCVFQDWDSGKMIGRAREKYGLYYLEASSYPSKTKNNLPRSFISKIVSNKAKIWLHHRSLGHPSFSALTILFPLLFKGIYVESLHCDIYEFPNIIVYLSPLVIVELLFLSH